MRLRTVCRKARSSARRIASLQDRLLLYKRIDLAKGNILVVWADDSANGLRLFTEVAPRKLIAHYSAPIHRSIENLGAITSSPALVVDFTKYCRL